MHGIWGLGPELVDTQNQEPNKVVDWHKVLYAFPKYKNTKLQAAVCSFPFLLPSLFEICNSSLRRLRLSVTMLVWILAFRITSFIIIG